MPEDELHLLGSRAAGDERGGVEVPQVVGDRVRQLDGLVPLGLPSPVVGRFAVRNRTPVLGGLRRAGLPALALLPVAPDGAALKSIRRLRTEQLGHAKP
ncbi:hypothetical protein ACWDXD_04430 [Streptomyces sp. NPDC003314]